MTRLSFSLRDVFWLTLVVAMGLGWWRQYLLMQNQEVEFRRTAFELGKDIRRQEAELVELRGLPSLNKSDQ
jgi:hypothetical protein